MPVIYVCGQMRSGTTILAQALASAPDSLLIGELRPILLDPANHNDCDCGETAQRCSFWGQIPDSCCGHDAESLDGTYSLRNVFRTLGTAVRHRDKPDRGLRVTSFLRQVREAGRDRPLIDSTKTPLGVLLWRVAGVRPHVVHIVRDPRAVARKQSQPTDLSQLATQSVFRTWLEWFVYTTMAYVIGKSPLAASYTLVRFSDFTRSPGQTLARISHGSGLEIPVPVDGAFVVTESHMRAGNPRRETTSVRIAEAG